MISLLLILILVGTLVFVICMGAVILIDPIICILVIYGLYRLVKWLRRKK